MSSQWPNFKTGERDKCLAWGQSQLISVQCSGDEELPAACTLPYGEDTCKVVLKVFRADPKCM